MDEPAGAFSGGPPRRRSSTCGRRFSIDIESAAVSSGQDPAISRRLAWQGLCRALVVFQRVCLRGVMDAASGSGAVHDETTLLSELGRTALTRAASWLARMGAGFGGIALAALLAEDLGRRQSARAAADALSAAGEARDHALHVRRAVAPGYVRPEAALDARQRAAACRLKNARGWSRFRTAWATSSARRSSFEQHGESGLPISSLFPHLARRADDLCVINSMHCSNSRHGGAVLEWHTGSDTFVRPSFGSWVTYGLGSENQNFPGYVTICQDLSQGGANNFGSAFLPAVYQGTTLGYAGEKPREARIPFIGDGTARRDLQRLELDLIAAWTGDEAANREPETELDARISSFELAFRLQAEAPEMLEIADESKATQTLYGLDDPATADFGTQCLLARRLSERGVRFVQCNLGGWDSHSNLKAAHSRLARAVDQADRRAC